MLNLLKTMAKEEEDTSSSWNNNGSWGYQKGSWGEKGKGKGKGKGKTDNEFQNPDGSVQKRCWNFDADQECWRKDCIHAHVRARTGINDNPPKKNTGTTGAVPTGGGNAAGATTATSTNVNGRRVIGRVVKKEEDTEKSEAAKVRETVGGALIDAEGLAEKGEGVEIAAMTSLTTAGELSEVTEEGESFNTVLAVEKKSKEYLETIKGYLSEDAKKNGTRIGAAGLLALYEGLLKLFKDQGMTKRPVNVIKEDEKTENTAED